MDLHDLDIDDGVWILGIILGTIGFFHGYETISITLIAISIIMLTYKKS